MKEKKNTRVPNLALKLGELKKAKEPTAPAITKSETKKTGFFFNILEQDYKLISNLTNNKRKNLEGNDYNKSVLINEMIENFRNKNKIKLIERKKGFIPTTRGRKFGGEKNIKRIKTTFSLTDENLEYMYDYINHIIETSNSDYIKANFISEIIKAY